MLTNDTNIQTRRTMRGLGRFAAAGVLLAVSVPVQAGYQGTRTTAPARSNSTSHATVAAPANRTGNASSHVNSRPANQTGMSGKGTSGSQGVSSSRNVNSNNNTNINNNSNTYVNRVGRGGSAAPSNPAGRNGLGTGRGPNLAGASSGNFNSNTNINNNSNTYVNRVGRGSSAAPSNPAGRNGLGTGRGPNLAGASSGNFTSNTNRNTNINNNSNVYVNKVGGDSTRSSGWNSGRGQSGSNLAGASSRNFNSNTNINNNSNVYINKVGRAGSGDSSRGRIHEGRIPDDHFRSHFGREHAFRFNHHVTDGERPGFLFGGVSFRAVQPWPVGWRETDEVYIDSFGGSYFLCNRAHPGVRIAVNAAECDSCNPEPLVAMNGGDCAQCAASNAPDPNNDVPSLYRGQTADQVVALLGSPKKVVDLGMKTMYLYDDMRVTFIAGRLSDVR